MSPTTDKQTTSDPIPLVTKLEDVYSSREAQLKQGQRWDALTKRFQESFGEKPDFIARAPGRVNVIGEHVDHMGFGVLPAAIELDILMVVRVVPHSSSSSSPSSSSSSAITFDLANTTDRFERATFQSDIKDPASVELLHEGPTRWANYFKVAWKGLHPHLPSSALSHPPSHIQVLVDGTIPPESSLSSSAAMTVCSSIVILEALGARPMVSRREMAEVAIESERYVGVASGGMDQSASIFGEPDAVLHIIFHPQLAISRVSMPPSNPEHTFLIANSLVISDKKVNGPIQYNLRVVELLIAARIFCLHPSIDIPLPDEGPEATPNWRRVMEFYFQKNSLDGDGADEEVQRVLREFGEEAAQLHILGQLIETVLPANGISLSEAQRLTHFPTTQAFSQAFLERFDVRTEQGFECLKRTRHVFAEAARVWRFKALLLSQQGEGEEGGGLYEKLGELMNQSHESLASSYQNTCPELETLISLARSSGSLGSRLTGAGWGGSTVHLVPTSKVDEVLRAWREGYYAKRWPELLVEDGGKLGEAMLVSRPAGGACVMRV